jgi:hypothetical protein
MLHRVLESGEILKQIKFYAVNILKRFTFYSPHNCVIFIHLCFNVFQNGLHLVRYV